MAQGIIVAHTRRCTRRVRLAPYRTPAYNARPTCLRAAPPTRGDGCSAATAPGAAPAPIKGWLSQKLFEARAPQPPVAAASQLRLNGQAKLAGKSVWGRG